MEALSLESNLLMMNDIVINKPYYAMESPLVLRTDKPSDTIFTKIAAGLKNLVEWLYDMVVKLINIIPSLLRKISAKCSNIAPSATIVDKYGYVDIVQRSMAIIDVYTKTLKSLRIIDHELNKSTSLMDEMKSKLKDTTIRSHTVQPSRRDNLENVILHFQKADEYKEGLDSLCDKLKVPIPVNYPKKYTLNFLKKEIEGGLNRQRRILVDLKKELENTRTIYNDSGFMYRMAHSNDIKRNQNILNHTSYVIEKIAQLQSVYPKLVIGE